MRYMVPVFDSGQTRDLMQTPDDVAVMLRLHELGWGAKRIARELGVSKNTVKNYLRQGDWNAYRTPVRSKTLDGLEDWLEKSFVQHGGNADVVRQDLARLHGIEVSLRTVERAVQPFRQQLAAAAKATVRFGAIGVGPTQSVDIPYISRENHPFSGAIGRFLGTKSGP
ncbi:helix-turn-helix domain-containing protein [Desulfuromonas versatilis]|nr:helix-turn-helix domain-containing protein [Desulfuromonas versatilis]